jgi:hypothetical protein
MRGAGQIWRRTLGDERGTAFLLGLTLVMVMSLLGMALFEMSTIEASLARSDVGDLQAFYCAEAQAARIYGLYTPESDPTASLVGAQSFGPASLALANGTYVFSGSAAVDPATQVVTVVATCALPSGRTRTVQRNGTRKFPNDAVRYSVAASGIDPATGAQALLGDVSLAGYGCGFYAALPGCAPLKRVGPSSGGADYITGDVYASGNVSIGGEASVVGLSTSDTSATIMVTPGRTVTSKSRNFDTSAPGAVGQGDLEPVPFVSNAQGTGVFDQIRKTVNPGGVPAMTGTYRGSTVYNLTEIFKQLGVSNEGNNERNLCRPGTSCSPHQGEPVCTFGVASSEPRCQIWQDLAIIGPKRQTCSPACPAGFVGPSDAPSYFFMGLPRSPSASPQGTAFSKIFHDAVAASAELRQVGLDKDSYSTLGQRLDALFDSVDGEGRADRLIDFTMGVSADGTSVRRANAPIFYMEGYWRADGGTPGLVYNGVATVVASKSMVLSDNILYLGGRSNTRVDSDPLPAASACGSDDGRAGCGFGDMMGLVAKDDIWIGDANGAIHEVSAVLLAGRDLGFFGYTSSGECCAGPSNPVSFTGSLIANRQVALVRDWADPSPGHENSACDVAQPPCQPVVFVPNDTTCGITGCWRFLTMSLANGGWSVDAAKSGFRDGCVTISSSPLTPPSCLPGTRRVTHFQLNVNYDARLLSTPKLVPPGLPDGGSTVYAKLMAGTWKDCGSNPSCR